LRILVVDDEKLNLVIASDLIQKVFNNKEVFLCSNPQDTINMIRKHSIDILLLDIVMPVTSGIQVLKDIRQTGLFNDIQIIMLTSLEDEESFKTCFDLGADDYIKKPINLNEFSSRIKAAIKTREHTLKLKELNKKLNETQLYMIQKEKMASIGELAAGIAHEINNPIGYVNSNLETLTSYMQKIVEAIGLYKEFAEKSSQAEGKLRNVELDLNESALSTLTENVTEEYRLLKERIKKIKLDYILDDLNSLITDSREGIEKVIKIVQSLKSFARTGFEDKLVYNSLEEIINEAIIIVKNESKYFVDIERIFAKVPEIQCNKGQLGQVILNVLVNAIQAIKTEKRNDRGKIIIETGYTKKYIYCSIKDDGPGIPENIIHRVFDPFFTTKEVGEGTGLGLSISYDIIVKKHKGELLVKNNIEKGACFTIKLPI